VIIFQSCVDRFYELLRKEQVDQDPNGSLTATNDVARGLHPQPAKVKLTTTTNRVALMLGLLIAIVTFLIGIAVYQRARKPGSPKRGTERDVPRKEQGVGSSEKTAKAQERTKEAKQEIDRPQEEVGVHETLETEALRNGERIDYPENSAEADVDRRRPGLPSQGSARESVCQGDESQRETEEAPQLDPQGNQPKPAVAIQAPQPGAEDPQQVKGTSVEPAHRGGRPRSPGHDSGKQSAEHKTRQAKPEIVCWKEGWQWIPAVELPEGFPAEPALTMVQDGQPLAPDECRQECWRLGQLSGAVQVSPCDQQSGSITIPLSEEFFLAKLSNRDPNQGRLVKTASCGSYLVIVPKGWTRDESLSGPAPFEPEPVCLPGYQAHFFNQDSAGIPNKIAFRTPCGFRGKAVTIPKSSRSAFRN
jgi:hypothetical protein